MNQLIIEEVNDRKEPSIPGREAAEMYAKIKRDVREAMREGKTIQMIEE